MSDPRELPLSLSKPELIALYRNLGGQEKGEAKLAEILKEFYRRMASDDIMIGFFFQGKDIEMIALKQKEFLMRAMGAAPTYSGKPPAKAHTELAPILTGHFDRRLQILEQVLVDFKLSAEDIRTWLTFENAFRDGIVSR